MNEPMHQVNVRKFEHRLLPRPQAGIAGEHHPFAAVIEER
jgi:hypothetical protein